MVKSLDFIDESIFNYLGKDDYAQFIALTGLCDGIRLNDGVVWVQFDDKEQITAIVSTTRNGKGLVFASENANNEELEFVTENKNQEIDKKYLLRKIVSCTSGENGIDKSEYLKIKNLNDADREKHNEIVAFKMLLNSMGKCKGALVSENGKDISGGFVTFSQKISLITDVYTNELYRGKGYGRAIVEKLLNLSINEDVYLVSKEHNLEFYKKCGFEIVKEIYDYKG
ncbi:MAG: GNAT family N-acetyltransferase [Clostridia bacterium]|nr:GNAT family N-acetyltransferase [Clostridia bacterium]